MDDTIQNTFIKSQYSYSNSGHDDQSESYPKKGYSQNLTLKQDIGRQGANPFQRTRS